MMSEIEIIQWWKDNRYMAFGGAPPECQDWARKRLEDSPNAWLSVVAGESWDFLPEEAQVDAYIILRLRLDYHPVSAQCAPVDCKSEPAPVESGWVEYDIGNVMANLAQTFDAELFALSAEQLREEWRWRWNPGASELGNVYKFFSHLGTHKYRCERWETHHNGSACVVERVRDKYIIPRIKELLEHLREVGRE